MRSVLVLALVLAGACRSEDVEDHGDAAQRFAEVTCDAARECECAAAALFGDGCERHYVEAFDETIARDLELDETCLDAILELRSDDPCSRDATWPSCLVFQGTRGVGDACEGHGDLAGLPTNECEADLRCNHVGLCASWPPTTLPPPDKDVGDGCWAESVESCGG